MTDHIAKPTEPTVSHVVHDERRWMVLDPLKPTPVVETETQGPLKMGSTETMIITRQDTAQEIKARYPWMVVQQFENPSTRPAVAATHRVFVMPEMPWKKTAKESADATES